MTTRWDSQLELYVDDQLSEHERREFALRLNQDPQLRAAVRLQHQIDQSLRSAFAVSPRLNADDLLHQILQSSNSLPSASDSAPDLRFEGRSVPLTRSRVRSIFRALGIAALLFISFASLWTAYSYVASDTSKQSRAVAIDVYYQQKVRTGFKPYWVCKNNQQFATTFRDRFTQPLLLAQPLPDGITASGLDYCHTLSPKTISVLMRDQTTPIVILVDRAEHAGAFPKPPAGSGLHTHQRTLGDLILLEVSPLAQPRMLHLFYNPDVEDKSSAPGKWQ